MEASCQGCRQRDACIAELEGRVAKLEAKVQDQAHLILDLARKLQDKDLPKGAAPTEEHEPKSSKSPPEKAKKRKPGGQPGHPPHLKQLLPPERVTDTVPIIPRQCQHCRKPLPSKPGANDPEPTRFQVAELPELKAKITEYQGHARTCPCCGCPKRMRQPGAISSARRKPAA